MSNGALALGKITVNKPDLVLLDILMPLMNGLETLRKIKEDHSDIDVVIISSYNREDADVTIQALRMGAFDFIPKPRNNDFQQNYNELSEKVGNIIDALTAKRKSGVRPARALFRKKPEKIEKKEVSGEPCRLVVVGVSTGGPRLLGDLFRQIRKSRDTSFMIAQHMPPLFTASLAAQIDKVSEYSVKEAEHNEELKPGYVYFGPGGKQLELRNGSPDGSYRLCVESASAEDFCRPSADILFESVASSYRDRCVALILTGMGNDGTKGMKVLKKKGAVCIAQNEETCTVFGMPRSVIEYGLADEILAPEEIAQRVNLLTGSGRL